MVCFNDLWCNMVRKRYRPEDIITKLRDADILIHQDNTVAATIRKLGANDVTYYRWRKEYGGIASIPGKGLKALEKEKSSICKAVSDLPIDK